jgi:hypothetical protein
MCKYKWTYFILLLFCISCEKKEGVIEKENIDSFYEMQSVLNKSVTYISENYLKSKSFSNRIRIVPNDSNFVRKNIHYDKYLGNLLTNDIIIISIRDGMSCMNNSKLPYELFFEIRSVSGRQYYYVYRFCGSNFKQISESLNYKLIPLNNKWSLEIEKN